MAAPAARRANVAVEMRDGAVVAVAPVAAVFVGVLTRIEAITIGVESRPVFAIADGLQGVVLYKYWLAPAGSGDIDALAKPRGGALEAVDEIILELKHCLGLLGPHESFWRDMNDSLPLRGVVEKVVDVIVVMAVVITSRII